LAPGNLPDIVFLDLQFPSWIATNDPTNQLAHTENGGAVTHVMIGGRIVVKIRRLTTVEVAALARDAKTARERLEAVRAGQGALPAARARSSGGASFPAGARAVACACYVGCN
jgi:hypothetical protein